MALDLLIRKGMACYLFCTGSKKPKSATSVGKKRQKQNHWKIVSAEFERAISQLGTAVYAVHL